MKLLWIITRIKNLKEFDFHQSLKKEKMIFEAFKAVSYIFNELLIFFFFNFLNINNFE